jgi:sugar lactone lactonase YvrE
MDQVDVLTVLPDVTPGVKSSVEGFTVGPDGNIYVPTFGFNTARALTGNAVLFVISPSGNIVRQVTIRDSSPHMLGLAFSPVTNALWLLDFGAGKVLNVDPHTGHSRPAPSPSPDSMRYPLTPRETAMYRIRSTAPSGRSVRTGAPQPPHGRASRCWATEPELSHRLRSKRR